MLKAQKDRINFKATRHLKAEDEKRLKDSEIVKFPVSKIKKIMKDIDESPKPTFMVSQDAPFIMSLAAEAFIAELAIRSNEMTEYHLRKNIQGKDVIEAARAEMDYDFLIDTLRHLEADTKK